jgi:hypothetical protein
MTLKSVDGQTVVQFEQAGYGSARNDYQLVSPEFPVNISLESRQTVMLKSRHLSRSPVATLSFMM